MAPSISTLLLGLLALPLVVVFYRLSVHPLAKFPGPRLAAASSLWHAYQTYCGREMLLGRTLHQRYGPVVRIAPNELVFDTPEAFRAFYRAGTPYVKSNFYMGLSREIVINKWFRRQGVDTLDLLGEMDVARYRLQRRLIGTVYSAKNMKRYEAMFDPVLERLVLKLHELNGEEVDLQDWVHIVAIACLSAVLGIPSRLIEDGAEHDTAEAAGLSWRKMSTTGILQPLCYLDVLYPPVVSWLWRVVGGAAPTKNAVRECIMQAAGRIEEKLLDGSENADLLSDLVSLHKQRPEFKRNYLQGMVFTNLGAGHDTITATVVASLAELGRHPNMRKRAQREIDGMADASKYDEASQLPFTQACIKEGLRLYPATSMPLARVVPPGGDTINGHVLPGGTEVGVNAVSLHRNPNIFGENADSFEPTRWLQDDRQMELTNLIWGGPNRTCPGRRLAELIVSKMMVAMLGNFDIEVVNDDFDVDSMPFFFTGALSGVRVKFVPRATRSAGVV